MCIEETSEEADRSTLLHHSILHYGETEFRRLLEKLPAGAYTCDPNGLITYFNHHAEQLWGRAPKLNDTGDRFCGSFKLFSADGVAIRHDQCSMALALENNQEYDGHEIVIERPNGERLTVLAHANPIHDDRGKLVGAVNVLVDITDRKRAEVAMRQADRSKDEFLATLAHELRNPLSAIRNAVQILHLKSIAEPSLRWAVDVIDRQTQQMTRLTDDLLDIARITCNKLELRRAQINLADVLNAAVETSRPLIESCGQIFTVSAPQEPIVLHADLTRLAQGISNLLNNAAKYTERGGSIWLKVERQGSEVVLTVEDSGVGIPADMLPRIFEMFTQVDQSLDRSRGGLGIGLALVRRLVEMHGGSISAHSDGPGQGSRFVIRLPILVENSTTCGTSNQSAVPARSTLPRRILVVDDNRDSASSLAMLLEFMGNRIQIAHDGEEAVQTAYEFQPDVVLLDIGLPKLNGYEAARRIRQQPSGNKTVLIAMTGWGQDSDRNRSREAGFNHHLVKPVDPSRLTRILESVGSC